MIQTYPNYYDQTQIIGLETNIEWNGLHTDIIAITPSCRITSVLSENRTSTVQSESRTVTIICQ